MSIRRTTQSAAVGVVSLARRALTPPGRRRDERGYCSIELVLYTPLIMLLALFSVQFALVYLGQQVASGAAREGNRVARVTGDGGAARGRVGELVGALGSGVLDSPQVRIRRIGDEVETTVSGEAAKVLPFIDPPRVSETVRGPIEAFVPDE